MGIVLKGYREYIQDRGVLVDSEVKDIINMNSLNTLIAEAIQTANNVLGYDNNHADSGKSFKDKIKDGLDTVKNKVSTVLSKIWEFILRIIGYFIKMINNLKDPYRGLKSSLANMTEFNLIMILTNIINKKYKGKPPTVDIILLSDDVFHSVVLSIVLLEMIRNDVPLCPVFGVIYLELEKVVHENKNVISDYMKSLEEVLRYISDLVKSDDGEKVAIDITQSIQYKNMTRVFKEISDTFLIPKLYDSEKKEFKTFSVADIDNVYRLEAMVAFGTFNSKMKEMQDSIEPALSIIRDMYDDVILSDKDAEKHDPLTYNKIIEQFKQLNTIAEQTITNINKYISDTIKEDSDRDANMIDMSKFNNSLVAASTEILDNLSAFSKLLSISIHNFEGLKIGVIECARRIKKVYNISILNSKIKSKKEKK